MKKVLLMLSIFILGMPVVLADETAEEQFYYATARNTYYQRSQHTYAFTGDDGVYHDSYAPSLYVLIDDYELSGNQTDWEFVSKYTIPWNVKNNEYYVAYCADISAIAHLQVPYRRVAVEDSTYLDTETKKRLIAILKNSYPYISFEEMKSQLLEEGVLEYLVGINGETVLTTAGNTLASRDITVDELVSATQMAINYYTNPGSIEKYYHKTFVLSSRSVLREHNLWTNEYPEGLYNAVGNNITNVTEYLITLSEDIPEKQHITSVTANNNKGEVYVYLNHELSKQDDFTIILKDNGEKVGNYNLDKVQTREDGAFVLTNVASKDLSKITIELNGSEYVENRLFVYEAANGEETSQTMVGLSTGHIAILDTYSDPVISEEGVMGEVKNPETKDLAIICCVIIIIAGATLTIVNFKKLRWIQQ